MSAELTRHAGALFRLLRLDVRGIEQFNPSTEAALRTLGLLFAIVPLRVFAAWVADLPYIESHGYYLLVRTVQVTLAILLPLPVIYWVCKSQGLEARFALYVTSYLWLALFWAVFAASMNGLTADTLFSIDTLKVTSTILFFITYGYSSFFGWAALRCSVPLAIGLAAISGLGMALTSDFSNHYMFGSARPHIGE